MSFTRPRRLTRAQKIELGKLGYEPGNYQLLIEEEGHFILLEKNTKNHVLVNRRKGNAK